jgi:pimeloyl-ACP methyl ester carboxylesterase
MKRPIVALIAGLVLMLAPAAALRAQSLAGTGVVLMHGKTGTAGSLLTDLAAALRKDGALVVTPEMPWARGRIYDASYAQARVQIGWLAADLRKRGANKIVIAGQSLGANAAIGYGVRHGDIAAVVAIAPGHNPQAPGFFKHTAAAVTKAKKLVAAGQGDTVQTFPDFNQGQVFDVRATAKVYLSYLDPDGPANMNRNAAAMKPVPFLLAVGRQDPLYRFVRPRIYGPAAKNPKSKFVEVGGGHKDTGRLAVVPIVAWLKSL